LRIGLPRTVEIILSLAGLSLSAPMLAVVALLIKADSRGPILFRQKRVGQNGKPFTMLKFRTMGNFCNGSLITAANDTRVTKVGRFLRRSKIDELPELWN